MSEETDAQCQGRKDFRAYRSSPSYSGIQNAFDIDAKDIMKLFWPPVKESMSQVQSPLPKDRREWLRGWELERQEAQKQEV